MNANKQRGEVTIEGPEGKEYKLCLTLGAIAQIEDQIEGMDSLSEVDKVFQKARMKDVMTIFVALLNGGGHIEITSKDMMTWNVPLKDLMQKIRDAFQAAGFDDGEGDENTEDGEGKGKN